MLGEAVRLELEDPRDGDVVHVQYVIGTDAGPWALWLTCPPADLGSQETNLAALVAAWDED